ncbi:MAG: methyltransferase domain-containing protein [Thermodesulfobacteriota bacterium]
MTGYVHGYGKRESKRLKDQADTLARLLHRGTRYPAGSRVLELGCGTGAQTVHLASGSPEAEIVSADLSPDSLEIAREKAARRGLANVSFQQADVFALPFAPASFDHAFVCFVLEHLAEQERALRCIREVLKPGGTLTVIEGDHRSWYAHPYSPFAQKAVDCLVAAQARLGGDANIGRRLYPLLGSAGFCQVKVRPKTVYVDASRPGLVEGFSKNTFIAMVEAAEKQAIDMGLSTKEEWDQGIRDLYRATEEDGTFLYTFFKARAVAPAG